MDGVIVHGNDMVIIADPNAIAPVDNNPALLTTPCDTANTTTTNHNRITDIGRLREMGFQKLRNLNHYEDYLCLICASYSKDFTIVTNRNCPKSDNPSEGENYRKLLQRYDGPKHGVCYQCFYTHMVDYNDDTKEWSFKSGIQPKCPKCGVIWYSSMFQTQVLQDEQSRNIIRRANPERFPGNYFPVNKTGNTIKQTKEEIHECPTCGYIYGTRIGLKSHKASHQVKVPCMAWNCARFLYPRNVKKHLSEEHKDGTYKNSHQTGSTNKKECEKGCGKLVRPSNHSRHLKVCKYEPPTKKMKGLKVSKTSKKKNSKSTKRKRQ